MIWHSLNEFAAMGGYAPYVWGAVGATAAAVALEVLALGARRRAALAAARLAAQLKGRA